MSPLLQPKVEIMIAAAIASTPGVPKMASHHCDRDAILRRVLDFGQRQGSDVGDVREHVEHDHNPATVEQGARKIPSRFAHFAADKRDVGPRRLREERSDHCFAK